MLLWPEPTPRLDAAFRRAQAELVALSGIAARNRGRRIRAERCIWCGLSCDPHRAWHRECWEEMQHRRELAAARRRSEEMLRRQGGAVARRVLAERLLPAVTACS